MINMKIKIIGVFIISVVCLLFAACNDNAETKQVQRSLLFPVSSGNPYEVMVVAEDSIWDGYAGRALNDVLNKPLKGLPQEESTFHVSRVSPKHYTRITNLFRNIIIIKTGKEYTQSKFRLERDVHSSPQIVMTIQGPSSADVSMYITEHTKFIINFFSDEEINRAAREFHDEHNIKFADKVKEMFDCELFIPVDIKKMKIGDDFIWASNDALSGLQNIVVYSYPYVTEKVFRKGVYIALRDSFMKRNIPGAKPNQYMATDKDHVEVRDISVRGEYAQEARGLWHMENDAMGGPFVAHSVVDTINNRVIVVEGFVYAPEKMKRSMIRRLEAALYTLKVP
jgi:hypothetical protein